MKTADIVNMLLEDDPDDMDPKDYVTSTPEAWLDIAEQLGWTSYWHPAQGLFDAHGEARLKLQINGVPRQLTLDIPSYAPDCLHIRVQIADDYARIIQFKRESLRDMHAALVRNLRAVQPNPPGKSWGFVWKYRDALKQAVKEVPGTQLIGPPD